MIDIEPVKYVNENGKVRWQPQLNGERLTKGGVWINWGRLGAVFSPTLVSRGAAIRIARRELTHRQRAKWTEAAS